MDNGETLLFNAVESKNKELVKLLIDLGADVNMKCEDGSPPLHQAVIFPSKEIVELLISHGAKVHAIDEENCNILHYTGDAHFTKFFLNLGVDIEALNIDGHTPLIDACQLEEPNAAEVVRTFLEYGANINHGQVSPVAEALLNGNLEVAKILAMHLAQMKSDGNSVSEANLLEIDGNKELRDFLDQCEKEIGAMKSQEIDDSSLTVHNLLQEQRKTVLEAWARNENIRKILTSADFQSNFPLFGSTITDRFDKGILRNDLVKQFYCFFHLLSTRKEGRLPKLPLTCLHQAITYLSNEDLTNIASFLR